jgi:hypothetical protein
MSEPEEVAAAIKEQHPEFFPLTSRAQAVSIATGQMPEESITIIQAVADALLEL